MNACAKFHGNPANSSRDISLKAANVNLLVALEEKSCDRQSGQDSSSGDHEYNKHFTAVHPIVVDISQSGPTDLNRGSFKLTTDMFALALKHH